MDELNQQDTKAPEAQVNKEQQPMAPQQIPTSGEPVTKKKSPVKIVILVVVGVFIAGAIMLALLILAVFNKTKPLTNDAKAFVSSIASADYTSAYGYFSPELQSVQPQSEFESQAATLNLTKDCSLKVESANAATENGKSTGSVQGTINCPNDSYKTSIDYLKQGDDYKIIKYTIQ